MTRTDDKWVVYDVDNARIHIHDAREPAEEQIHYANALGVEVELYPPGDRPAVPQDVEVNDHA